MKQARRGGLLVALALVLGGLAASDVARREADVAAQLAPLVPVVVAHADLGAGTKVKRDHLAVRRIPERYAPVGAARSSEELVGRELVVPVVAGAAVGESQLADPLAGGAPVSRGERAVEVVGIGSSDLIVAGAKVDVLVTRERDSRSAGGTQLALENVEVIAARRVSGDADGADVPRVSATLRVSPRQAVYLAAAQSFAREIRLLPRAIGDSGRVGAMAVRDDLGG